LNNQLSTTNYQPTLEPLRILVSNDDGIDSPGITALARALRSIGEVDVVAPDTQQSAVGHALTVARPLRAVKHERNGEFFGWAISGKPADCVKLAVTHLLPERPHIVVSGINHGRNTAVSLVYSGTVSAATEGTMLGIPSIAISLDDFSQTADFDFAAKVAAWLTPIVAGRGLPHGTLLNVNVPAIPESEIKGVRIAEQGESFWSDSYEARFDPMGRPYYWLKGEYVVTGVENSDDHAIEAGYVSITPIHYRLTDFRLLEQMREWGIESDEGELPRSSAEVRSVSEKGE
jgi:5'-nucleotidase